MPFSFKLLWYLLVEWEINKVDLIRATKMTSNIVSKVSKDYHVDLETSEMICIALECNGENIVEIYQEDK